MAKVPPKPPAVFCAAKSTEDVHGSIPTQFDDCRREHGGEYRIIGEFQDEGFSAYHGNRGPGLEAAKQAAANAAAEYGEAALIVQHSDRLARGAGDAPGASRICLRSSTGRSEIGSRFGRFRTTSTLIREPHG